MHVHWRRMTAELDTHQRALAVNLDASSFGTFAEIGAGQEVARWFLQVGGAAGTVAKTISAYDMAFSDAIYGKSGRYVSRERLIAMLDHEYRLLCERLDESRGEKTRFFVFADTVAARNYGGTNECHGWVGLRFQDGPRGAPSDVRLHVNMRDPTNLLQQQALGILGVNLLYAAYFEDRAPEALLGSLFAGLALERIEIDVVELDGPAFAGADPAALGPLLVRGGFAHAVLLEKDGSLVQPSSVLRKRALALERGAPDARLPFRAERLASAARRLGREFPALEQEALALYELSVKPARGAAPEDGELRRRIADLGARDARVLLSRFPEAFRLTEYLRRYTTEPLGFALEVSTLVQLFEASAYADVIGGVLEALGKLLAEHVRIYVHPMPAEAFRAELARAGVDARGIECPTDGLVSAERIRLAPPTGHLYAYLFESGWIVPLEAES